MYPRQEPVSTTDYATATHAAAVITYTAVANYHHAISGIAWSYSGGTPAGSLTVADGASTVFSIDITAAGPGFIPFEPGKKGTVNTNLVITLADGGSGIVGKVNVSSHWKVPTQ